MGGVGLGLGGVGWGCYTERGSFAGSGILTTRWHAARHIGHFIAASEDSSTSISMPYPRVTKGQRSFMQS